MVESIVDLVTVYEWILGYIYIHFHLYFRNPPVLKKSCESWYARIQAYNPVFTVNQSKPGESELPRDLFFFFLRKTENQLSEFHGKGMKNAGKKNEKKIDPSRKERRVPLELLKSQILLFCSRRNVTHFTRKIKKIYSMLFEKLLPLD